MRPCELSRFNQLPKAPLARLKQPELDGFQKQAKWSSSLQFLDQILQKMSVQNFLTGVCSSRHGFSTQIQNLRPCFYMWRRTSRPRLMFLVFR